MMNCWLLLLQVLTVAVFACDNLLDKDPETACQFTNVLTITNAKGETLDSQNCGTLKVDKTDWQKEPKVTFSQAKENATYTMLLIDPDVPNYPKGQYYLHWLIKNIPGSAFRIGDTSKGDSTDEPYVGPAPPANSGDHRYLFLALEESVINQNITSPNGRSSFEFLKWLNGQDEELCGPTAGAGFIAAYN